MELNFKQIRANPISQRDSFEVLSVQLFYKSYPVSNAASFISLKGDGGDGGVEAYFKTFDNKLIGIQAKYFFQLKSSEIGQIDRSLRTAISNHPTLSEYWIYIPFDLTGRRAQGRSGKSEAERFEEWKREVRDEFLKDGKTIEIKLCTATVIQEQLLALDKGGGLRKYWFDDAALTSSHIKSCLDESIAFAGPRYISDLDFVTEAHQTIDFFGGIGDWNSWYKESILPHVEQMKYQYQMKAKIFDILHGEKLREVNRLIDEIIYNSGKLLDDTVIEIDLNQKIKKLLPLLEEVQEQHENLFYKEHGRANDNPNFRQFHAEYMCEFPAGDMDNARDWVKTILALKDSLSASIIKAKKSTSLLLIGPAGIGKTHALVSSALRRLERNGLSLVLFGDDFGYEEPWEVIRTKLGFGSNITRQTLFECLQAGADHTNLPFIIFIDALNESPRNARWKSKLPELLSQCKQYTGIKICVSTRDTYLNVVVDSRFPGFAFKYHGFRGKEFEAIQAFAKYYDLATEITPAFSPELSNPLFLHLACKSLKYEGKTSFDLSFPGFTSLIDTHLKHSDELIRGRLNYANPRNIVKTAMLCLASFLTKTDEKNRAWEDCYKVLEKKVGISVGVEQLLQELASEGLIIISEDKEGEWIVRLGYQRYGDVLRAIQFIESLKANTKEDKKRELTQQINTVVVEKDGLLEALAIVLPELLDIEITSLELDDISEEDLNKLFIASLGYRSATSITYATKEQIRKALFIPGLWDKIYEILFRVSLIPHHPLNIDNFFTELLSQQTMSVRDVFLSKIAFDSYENKEAVWFLINSALQLDITLWNKESAYLAMNTLAWLTSVPDRRIRDLSSKGMARLLTYFPEYSYNLAKEFLYSDDEYILERIVIAIYSASLLKPNYKEKFIPALDALLTPHFDRANILIRDTIRLLADHLGGEDLSQDLVKRLSAYPQQQSLPEIWPTMEEAKSLLDLDNLPVNMKLWGSGLAPDFWRYRVENIIRKFDLNSLGITEENIASWFMTGVGKLGYPGPNNITLNADQYNISQFGQGRARKGYAERIGKKYYWILLHRLIGLLVDNCPPKKEYSDWLPEADHLWSLYVRKVDLTDMRDVYPGKKYPDDLIAGEPYIFPDVEKSTLDELEKFVCKDDFTDHSNLVFHQYEEENWVLLDFYISEYDKAERDFSDPYLGVCLLYRSAFIDDKQKLDLKNDDLFQTMESSGYYGYIAEYPNSRVYDQLENEGYLHAEDNYEFTQMSLLRGGEWEYDYSSFSKEPSESLSVPSRNLIKQLDLRWDNQRGWIDQYGELVIFEAKHANRQGLLIKKSALDKYLELTKQQLVLRRFINRLYFHQKSDINIQLDKFTWLKYKGNDLKKLDEKYEIFGCEQDLDNCIGEIRYPFV